MRRGVGMRCEVMKWTGRTDVRPGNGMDEQA